MPAPAVVIVVAVAANGVIGRDGEMPWRLSTDLKRFKALTLGHPVIMGRKTYASIGKALPGRRNIVLTRSAGFQAGDAETASTMEEALTLASTASHAGTSQDVFIIGGGEIYALAMPLAQRLHVTHVDLSPEGDAHFPAIDATEWRPVSQEIVPAGERDSASSRYVVYERTGGTKARKG
jgi:dihydrofolate reductase